MIPTTPVSADCAPPQTSSRGGHRSRSLLAVLAACATCLSGLGEAALAQDQIIYRNTQSGRPVRTEDAYAVDRYTLDMHLAPVSIERSRSDAYRWAATPGMIYGLLPRTQIELSVPVVYRSGTDEPRVGIAGITLGALYNFNAETRRWPALGLRAGLVLPAGGLGLARAHPSLTLLGTRTIRGLRVHVNTMYAFRDEPQASIDPLVPLLPSAEAAPPLISHTGAGLSDTGAGVAPGLSRWTAGLAVDRTFALASLLVAAEILAVRPFGLEEEVQWNAGLGMRHQLTPNVSADASIARQLSGPQQTWSISLGVGRTVSMRSILPGFGRWGNR